MSAEPKEKLRDTVSFRNSEISKEVGILTSRGTAAMVNISNKTSHEAQVVKVLTLVALVFLPTSFAAVSIFIRALWNVIFNIW